MVAQGLWREHRVGWLVDGMGTGGSASLSSTDPSFLNLSFGFALQPLIPAVKQVYGPEGGMNVFPMPIPHIQVKP